MTASDVQILPGETRAGVNVAALEGDWEALLAAPADAAGEPAAMQVRTLNLLAPAPAAREAEVLRQLQPVLLQHPSRAIVILHHSPTVAGLSSRATGICRTVPGTSALLCCEQAVIEAGHVPIEHIVQAATPLLLPDLPTFLWWHEPLPVENALLPLFDGLGELSQRLVVDSALSRDARATLELLSAWVTTRPFRISDCNWARLTPWRELTARLFDPPRLRMQMHQIRELHIDCIAAEDVGAQTLALLYTGWLASRLGWNVIDSEVGADRLLVRFAAGAGTVRVFLDTGCGRQTGLRKVRLVTTEAEFHIWHPHGKNLLRAESVTGSERTLVHAVGFRPADDSTLLTDELNLVSHDPVFEQSLRQAAAILRHPDD